jgi:hypothetical protein
VRIEDLIPDADTAFAQPILAAFASPTMVTKETDVAQAIWQAANDNTGKLRFPAGTDAVALANVQ